LLVVMLAGAVASEGAFADEPSRGTKTGDVLKRVDPGRADVGPSSISQRVISRDPRSPSGFEYVYRIERGRYAGRFARANGAVTAVFPRSVYSQVDGTLIPRVPPGTTYVVGPIDDVVGLPRGDGVRGSEPARANAATSMPREMNIVGAVMRSASRPASAATVDRRAGGDTIAAADAGGGEGVSDGPPPSPPQVTRTQTRPRTIWTDESLRSERVRTLLESVRRTAAAPAPRSKRRRRPST